MSVRQHILIMAGGSGKRMGLDCPKQILNVGHTSMIFHLLDLANSLQNDVILVLSKKNKDQIFAHLESKDVVFSDGKIIYNQITIWVAIQEIADGTGGAIRTARDKVFYSEDYGYDPNARNSVLILSADVPLISQYSASRMLNIMKAETNFKCVIYAQNRENPHGYGRVLIHPDGRVTIVEQKDIYLDDIDKVTLINTGIYVFEAEALFSTLNFLTNDNANHEYYLTDVPRIIQDNLGNRTIDIYLKPDFVDWDETMGANTPGQLADMRAEYMKMFRVIEITEEATALCHEDVVEYMECLAELTSVNLPHDMKTTSEVAEYIAFLPDNQKIFVVSYAEKIVATFSIMIEQKIIHQMSSVAHVEDVVIKKEFRGIGMGNTILDFIKAYCTTYNDSHSHKIYKIILECSDDVLNFYERNEFKKVGYSMRYDVEI